MNVSCHQWRAWQRRADTLHRNATALLSDVINRCGEEHAVSDRADNVVAELEELGDAISWEAKNAKSKGRQSTPTPNVKDCDDK